MTSLIDGQRARDDAGGREGDERRRRRRRRGGWGRGRIGRTDGKNDEKRGIGCGWRPTQGVVWGGQGAKGMDVDQVRSSGYGPKLRILNWTPKLTGTFPLSLFP